MQLTHLQRLEAESIRILREVVAEFQRPVMLYSIGKDSSVMLRLAQKAFYPQAIPFPLLHIDTLWKFREMIAHRDRVARELALDLRVWTHEARADPFTLGTQKYTYIMKTLALRQALDHYGFDAAFGGARRDEEKSRAKERVFSFRDRQHGWDPKNQRPELWQIYNTALCKGESIRVFPLSNWTELDVWLYIHQESIPIVPLYLAAERTVVSRDGALILVDDDRLPLQPGEQPRQEWVRFRTLGCYPLSGAVESRAKTIPEVVTETLQSRYSERQGRIIDYDEAGTMEDKKREGYF
jgi:sulfate adenylyltransferase subunit 2